MLKNETKVEFIPFYGNRLPMIRNECRWDVLEITREASLRWFGHERKKNYGYVGRRMLRMELPGKRKRGRPKRRFMDVVREDTAVVERTLAAEIVNKYRENLLWRPLVGEAKRQRRADHQRLQSASSLK